VHADVPFSGSQCGRFGYCREFCQAKGHGEEVNSRAGRGLRTEKRFITFSAGGCKPSGRQRSAGERAGLDHKGFDDAVRPSASDPIQPGIASRERVT